jgi:hypothetical protein
MYTNDATVFINPKKDDVDAFAGLCECFGQATGLCTNIQKSQVKPIRCAGIDLDDLLESTPTTRASFPMKYLGLPLAMTRLHKADLQPLFDKSARHLVGWRGRNIGIGGRGITLVKSILTSATCLLWTTLKVTKESLEVLDKQRKWFLCAGADNITGEKCKANWARTCMPTAYEGLGVFNLEKFARALRVRWLWHEWKAPNQGESQNLGLSRSKTPCAFNSLGFAIFYSSLFLVNVTFTPVLVR